MLDDFLILSVKKYVSIVDIPLEAFSKPLKSVFYDWIYYHRNPLMSVDVFSKLVLRWNGGMVRELKNKYLHQRQHIAHSFHYFNEPNKIDFQKLRLSAQKYNRNGEDFRIQFFKTETPQHPTSLNNDTVINFLMALSGRRKIFLRFLENFETAFLQKNERVNLWISYFPKEHLRVNKTAELIGGIFDEDALFMRKAINTLRAKYPERLIEVIVLEKGKVFSRGIGLQEASKRIENRNEILFFCDVDLVFAPDTLSHIRRNTVRGKRVYYPVFFSQYDPDVVYAEKERPRTHFSFEELDGFWRYFSYGMLSIYKSDFDRTEGFDVDIRGWGLEDIEMVRKIYRVATSGSNAFVTAGVVSNFS